MPNLGTAWFQQAAWLSHMLGVAAAAAKACAQAARLVERVTGRAAACPLRSSSSGVQCLRSQHSRQLAPGPPVSLPAHGPPPARSSSPSLRAGRRSGAAHTAGGRVEAGGGRGRQQRGVLAAQWHLVLAGRHTQACMQQAAAQLLSSQCRSACGIPTAHYSPPKRCRPRMRAHWRSSACAACGRAGEAGWARAMCHAACRRRPGRCWCRCCWPAHHCY